MIEQIQMNSDIGTRQNQPEFQRLLKARQWRWAVAVRWQKAQMALVLFAPLLALTLGMVFPGSKPWISFIAVCSTLIDVAWLDRAYKGALKAGARASELFDCELLRMDWNSIVTGKPPTPEETDRAARGWENLENKGSIIDWYSTDVDKVSIDLARVICQRTNLTYDSDLRHTYRLCLDVAMASLSALLLGMALLSSGKFSDFVLFAWVPTAPLLIWALRERFRQADTVQSNQPVIAEAEKLILSVIDVKCDTNKCRNQSRLLQDAIFYRRSTAVLLFPGIYRFRREDAERDMRAGADYWVKKNSEAELARRS